MQLARVIGNVVATRKDPALDGRKLLFVQPVTPSGDAFGEPLIAVDGVGVGVGEEVFFVKGKEASFLFLPDVVPVDVGIVGRVDHDSHRSHDGHHSKRRSPRKIK